MEQQQPKGNRSQAQTAGSGPARSKLIGVVELAEVLGVDPRHIYRLVAERRVPYIKWAHLLRFDPVEVQLWIDRNRVDPSTPARP